MKEENSKRERRGSNFMGEEEKRTKVRREWKEKKEKNPKAQSWGARGRAE